MLASPAIVAIVLAAGSPWEFTCGHPGSSRAESRSRQWHAATQIVLKCRDLEALARFWCEVLDFIELDREEGVYVERGPREGFGGPQPTIFIRNDEPKNEHAGCTSTSTPPTATRTPNLTASWPPGPDSSTLASPRRRPGMSSPIQKVTSSACSDPPRPALTGPPPGPKRASATGGRPRQRKQL